MDRRSDDPRAASEPTGAGEPLEAIARMLASALDRIGQGVVICDPAGTVVFRNARAGNLVRGRGGDVIAAQAVSGALDAALAGGTPEETLELFAPYRRTLIIRAFPLHGEGADGSSAGGSPAGGGEGGLVGAVAVVEDISVRRRVEDMRRDFVANVSHELKTPVGALSLLAETLDGEEDPEVVARLISRVGTEADRLGRIIDHLLDLSRIETDEQAVRQLVRVQDILDEAVEPLRVVARNHDIDLVVAAVTPALAVRGDRRYLVSAVANLVDNAIKYSEQGSCVTVEVVCDEGWAEINVTDQGIGIPSRDLERIFERFYRVDRARSRTTGGTGLGLSIVRNVAVEHGGSVAVRSVEGEGSTFTLRLPVETLPAAGLREARGA